MAIDFDALVIKPCVSIFGEPIIYTAVGSLNPLSINGVFDPANHDIVINEGVPMTMLRPVLGVYVADFPSPPQQNDICVVRGVTYTVREPIFDGRGNCKLYLNNIEG
jgi:hypothetical protein